MGIQGKKLSNSGKAQKKKLAYVLGIVRNTVGGQCAKEEVAGDGVRQVFRGQRPEARKGSTLKITENV